MVVFEVPVNNCSPVTIVLGRRGTYNTQEVTFDLSYLVENYGAGTAVLMVKRSQDTSAYPAVVSQEGNTLTWGVSDVDTYYPGSGECELMWYVDEGLAKTIIYPMVVMRDILATSEEAPDAYQTWVDNLTALGAETLQNAQDAAQSATEAENAKDDAVDAKEAAEEAAETAQEAVVHAPIIQDGYWYIWNNGQYVNTNVRAEGQKGDKGDTGEKGDTGNGIASITKTGTAGLVDTYTVTYTNGTTTTFTVTNGAKGDKGDTGATGNGIQSITKTGTSGNVDTYTITYTNGQTVTFTVTNGAVSSVAGKTGAVTLDGGDVGFSDSAAYTSGTVGAELSDLTRQLSDVESAFTNIENNVVFGANAEYYPEWVKGMYNGNANQSLTTYDTAAYQNLYKRFYIQPTTYMKLIISTGYKATIRVVNESNVVQIRLNNITSNFALNPTFRYAIQVESSTGANIYDVDASAIATVEYINEYDTSDIVKTGCIKVTGWNLGAYNGSVGSTLTFYSWYTISKYTFTDSKYPITGTVANGYKATIYEADEDNKCIRRYSDCYTFFALPAGRYSINVAKQDSSSIYNIDTDDLINVYIHVEQPKQVYKYAPATALTTISTGDTSRRVQGGCVYGSYGYYCQPSNDESESTLITKINLSTGAVVSSIDSYSCGHASAMTYNPVKNVLVVANYENNTTFYEIDADTLALSNTYTVENMRTFGLQYDETNDVYIVVSSYGSGLDYMTASQMDTDTFELIDTAIPTMLSPMGGQDIGSDGTFIYFPWNSYTTTSSGTVFENAILVFDLNGNFVGYHTIDSTDEIQWVDVTNGVMYGAFDGSAEFVRIGRTLKWVSD